MICLNVHLLIKDKIKRVYKQFPIRTNEEKKLYKRKAFGKTKRLCNLPKKTLNPCGHFR